VCYLSVLDFTMRETMQPRFGRFSHYVVAMIVMTSAGRLCAQSDQGNPGLNPHDRKSQIRHLNPDHDFYNSVVRGRVTQNFEIYNPHSADQLKTVKEMGFTQVILDWPNLHDFASEVGLNIVLANWWTPTTEFETLEKGLANAKLVDPKRLVAVSMMDEPERNSPETPLTYYEALYNDLRRRFDQELPGIKLELSHWGPLKSWSHDHYEAFVPLYRGTDRIRLMPYPDLDEGPLNEVFLQMMRSRQLMKLAGRQLPQVIILQTWVLPDDPKLPTIDELRVMAYQAILCGADVLSFFSYDPVVWGKTEGFPSGFSKLMQELTMFSRLYRDATVESRMSKEGVLSATLTLPDARTLMVTVNTNRNPVQDLGSLEVAVVDTGYAVVDLDGAESCTRKSRPALRRRIFRERFWR
jgi:hypothetical protein